jgi:16S rRNA (guanine966-N2)-methyltransferase
MRILSGQFKGKSLSAGKDLSIRPTTSRIKEVIFSILGDYCQDKWILDLFSGSGSLGFEAVSRGARGVIFVEKAQSSIEILKQNLNELSINSDKVEIIRADVLDYVRRGENSHQLILADPPFKYSQMQYMVDEICNSGILDQKGLFILHHEIDNPIELNADRYQVMKQKKVGRSLISFIVQGGGNV